MPDDTTGIFKPDIKTVEKIFSDADSYYQVPDYQRPYSWEDEHIEQLWDDLYSAMESGDESYFLGPMILIGPKDGYFEVVDGQQRLTTLTILFCVIRDLYKDEFEKTDKLLTNKIKNTIISMVNEEPRLKLITQMQCQIKFEQEILYGVKFPAKELARKERDNERFINTALIFKQKLEELKKTNGIETIRGFVNYILKNVEMITITCLRQKYAIKLFQVLNTRGLDLSPADLIKSYLYGRLSDKIKQQAFISTWNEIEDLSKQIDESITDLLTYYEYYLLAQNPKRSLYEELTDKFKNEEPDKTIYEFKKFVDIYCKITKITSKLIFAFWYLPNQVFWKAILTTAKKEGFNGFEGLCKELRKVYYCYWIAGHTTSKIKQLSFNLVDWLKKKKTLEEIRAEIDKKIADDNVVKLIRENLYNDVYGKPWLKPLLILIEYEQTDNSKITFIELERNLQIDHILPDKWSSIKDWKKNWSLEQAKRCLHRLGNLTLLSGRKNNAASNDSFKNKLEIYKGKGFDGVAAFLITQRIIKESDWMENNVKDRQRWMIKQTEKILDIELTMRLKRRVGTG